MSDWHVMRCDATENELSKDKNGAFIHCCVSLAVCLGSPVVSSGVISAWHCQAAFKLFPLTYCTEKFTAPTVIHSALLIRT